MTEDWAFHYGGRSEIQYNIGFEDEGFRFGLAFSLETSQTLPDINLLKPKIKKLNTLYEEKPELFFRIIRCGIGKMENGVKYLILEK